MRSVALAILLVLALTLSTGAFAAELARRDCSARAKYSPFVYVYHWPFSCVYAGEKPVAVP